MRVLGVLVTMAGVVNGVLFAVVFASKATAGSAYAYAVIVVLLLAAVAGVAGGRALWRPVVSPA